jgi:hypothetical protein
MSEGETRAVTADHLPWLVGLRLDESTTVERASKLPLV